MAMMGTHVATAAIILSPRLPEGPFVTLALSNTHYMSEIPLHSIRHNHSRAGYSPLPDTNETPTTSNASDMPSVSRIVAAASRSTLRKYPGASKGKRKERYTDEEEESRLLPNTSDEDRYDEGGGIRVPVTSQPV